MNIKEKIMNLVYDNADEEEKGSLKRELEKDSVITRLKKNKNLDIKIYIVLFALIVVMFSMLISQHATNSMLNQQIAQQQGMLKDIANNIQYKEERKKIAKQLFRKVAYVYNPKVDPIRLNNLCDQTFDSGEIELGIKMEFWMVLIATECQFYLDDVSYLGAIDPYQIMPDTGKAYCSMLGLSWAGPTTLKDIKINAKIGCKYMFDLMEYLDNDPIMYITAYNWGATGAKQLNRQGLLKKKNFQKYYLMFMKNKEKIEKILGYEINLKYIKN